MTCHRIHNGIICVSEYERIDLTLYGCQVCVEFDPRFGPEFYRSVKSVVAIKKPSRKMWAAFEAWHKEQKP